MKKTFIYLIGILATVSLFTSCEKNPPTEEVMPPSFFANVSALVVNEQGEPIPNVEFWYSVARNTEVIGTYPYCIDFSDYESYREIYTNGTGLRTDEKGELVFPVYEVDLYSRTEYMIASFFDTDGEENGNYEPLFIKDPITVDLVWNGQKFDGTTNNLFEPIDLGTFVMHEKK